MRGRWAPGSAGGADAGADAGAADGESLEAATDGVAVAGAVDPPGVIDPGAGLPRPGDAAASPLTADGETRVIASTTNASTMTPMSSA